MAITTKDISHLARVSTATVSRVLNNKPGVLPRTREAVLKVVSELGYQPNLLSKALASRKTMTLGVISLPEKHVFGPSLMRGIQTAEAQYRDFGLKLRIHLPRDLDPAGQARAIREMIRARVDGLALVAIDAEDVRHALAEAAAKGIPTVTFNNPIRNDGQLCFVGQDAFQSGEVAADLLARFIGGRGEVFVLNGFHHFTGHSQRLLGFRAVCEARCPALRIVDVQECFDDEISAFQLTQRALRDFPKLRGIYVVGAGIGAMGKAVVQAGKAGRIHVVCYDLPPEEIHLLREGVIDAMFTQDPITQGHLPIRILFELLYGGKAPERKFFYTKTEIITQYLLGNVAVLAPEADWQLITPKF